MAPHMAPNSLTVLTVTLRMMQSSLAGSQPLVHQFQIGLEAYSWTIKPASSGGGQSSGDGDAGCTSFPIVQ